MPFLSECRNEIVLRIYGFFFSVCWWCSSWMRIKMEERTVSESHLTSAAAFVEGEIQEASDDSCSICLEAFCDSNPSTLTSCKHEFHLQCILEWCQRSSQCPMCWQAISLKDPSSQELLDAVDHERNMQMGLPRNMTISHHPTLGDFELQYLSVSASESEVEEHIIQHLAAAASMGQARQLAKREGQRNRSSSSTNPNGASVSSSRDNTEPPPTVTITGPSSAVIVVGGDSENVSRLPPVQAGQLLTTPQHGSYPTHRRSPARTSHSRDRAGPSDFQSFSLYLKWRLSALSTRYKESITKSTRGWKERLFACNNRSTLGANAQTRREVGKGIASVSRMMNNNLDTAENSRTNTFAASNNNNAEDILVTPNPTERPIRVMGGTPLSENEARAPCSASI